MSIQTEITRLQGLRNALRAALVALGLAQSSADLEDCVTAVEGITNNGAVAGTISNAATPYTVPGGYHNGQGTVDIAPTEKAKLVAGNIKSGVTIKNAIIGSSVVVDKDKIGTQDDIVLYTEED